MSNGKRFVSANRHIRNISADTGCVKQNHQPPDWYRPISKRLSGFWTEPEIQSTTGRTESPMQSSKLITCAEARIAPKYGNLLFDDHPAMHEANTPSELTASAASRLKSMSQAAIGTSPSAPRHTPKGISPATTRTGRERHYGRRNIPELAHVRGNRILLEEEFEPVGCELHQTVLFEEIAYKRYRRHERYRRPVWPVPALNVRADFSLGDHAEPRKGHYQHYRKKREEDLQQNPARRNSGGR